MLPPMCISKMSIPTRQHLLGKKKKGAHNSLTHFCDKKKSEKYTYFEGKYGTRVLAYGFLYNFKGNGNNSVVQSVANEIQQSWFNQSLTQHHPDLITVIGHVGIRFTEVHTVIKAIRAHYPTIPIAVLGGHT